MWGDRYKKVLKLTITLLFILIGVSNIKMDANVKQNSVFGWHILYKKIY